MRLSASWMLLVCLSFGACSDDDKGQSEGASEASDASTEQDKKSDERSSDGKKSSGNAEKGAAGSNGSKSTSSANGDKSPSDAGKKDDQKSDEAKGDEPAKGNDDKKPEGDGKQPDQPKPDDGKKDEGTAQDAGAQTAGPKTNGDQLAVCSMLEGDCNQGLACRAPAGPFSSGRGFCSKICEQDEDCSGLAPEGTRYTCGTGSGTRTCEIACSGADDSSCPSSLACVQTGVRRRAVAATDAGAAPEGEADAGSAIESAFEPIFNCRVPFETSKIWEPCGDAAHVCGEGLRCASAFWFGGSGHCTRGCAADADCAKPESGSATPSCLTLVPAFGETPAIKQCVLTCVGAADGCPNGLTCFEGPEASSEMGAEPVPAFAWCQ